MAAIGATSAGVAAGSAAAPNARTARSAAGGGAATASSAKRLKVTPSSGTSHTAFVVHLAKAVQLSSGDSISVQATREHPAGCRPFGATVGTTSAGTHRKFRLGAPARGWCAGTYSGTVDETIRPTCEPGQACPQFIALTRLGSFRFTVRRTR